MNYDILHSILNSLKKLRYNKTIIIREKRVLCGQKCRDGRRIYISYGYAILLWEWGSN